MHNLDLKGINSRNKQKKIQITVVNIIDRTGFILT